MSNYNILSNPPPRPQVTAQYRGICKNCGTRWEEGETITPYKGGGWQHYTCPDTDDPTLLRKYEKVCTTCFLVHPEGACGE